MKPRAFRFPGKTMLACATAGLLLPTTLVLRASDLHWDGDDTTADADGGSGTWNTSSTNWDDVATAGTDSIWSNSNPDNAFFGGAAGTITLGEAITAGSLTFQTNGYTLALGGFTLNLNSGITANEGATISGAGSIVFGANNTWSVASDKTLTVSSNIGASAFSLTKTGAGILSLTGTNSYTGGTSINAGTLSFANGSLGTTGAITMGGGTLQWASGNTQDISSRLILLASTSATLDTNGNNVTLATGFGGSTSASLVKTGSGTLTLSGANTFTGRTTITGGVLSIDADSRLGAAPGSPVANHLEINGGTLRITSGNQTISANRGITIGASGAGFDTSGVSSTTNNNVTLAGIITGTGNLTLAAHGDMTAAGGGSSTRLILNNTGNNFIGNVTITSGLVSYASNASFGNASNKIILNGGGLLDANSNIALPRDIEIQSGGGTFRAFGSTNVTWSGAITGTGTINRTDGGTISHSGDLSGFGGTYNVQAGTTQLTGTAATIGGNWTVSSGTTLVINSITAQSLAGSITGAGNLRINSASLTASASNAWNVDNIQFTGSTSALNIGEGANVTTRYIDMGSQATGNSGRIVQTGGNVTLLAGGTGFRIGHWNNGSNPGSLYNLSGGVLDATGLAGNAGAASVVNIGWDGQGDMIVGGGLSSATLRAPGIQLDGSGNGGGSGLGDMTLTVSANGLVEIGAAGVGAAATGDRIILNGGSMRATANATWGAVMNANTSTTSVLEANNFNVTLNQNITGDGSINLSSASGSVIFNTSGSQTVSAVLNGITAISKTGTGTTTLSGTGSNHTGTISVSAGRLNLSGTSASAISIGSGTTLGGEGTTSGAVALSSGFLNIDPTTASRLTVGNLALTGTNVIRFDTSPTVAGGAFQVLTYTGALTGTIGTNLVLENATRYRNSTLVDTSGVITLDIQSKNLTWNGASGEQWDTLSSSRWNAGEVDQFAWGDAVTFDDTGVTTNITITGELQPAAITVAGSQNYTLTGSAGNFISGSSSITKSGSSTLVLNAPNTFSGANAINAGIIQVGNGTNNTATMGTGSVAIASGASLVFFHNGTTAFAANQTITGSGTLAFQGTGVSNQSQYSIGGNNTSFAGTVDIRAGARLFVDSAVDVGTAGIVVNSGGQLWVSGPTLSNNVTLAGNGWNEPAGLLGAVRFTGGTLSGGVTLAGQTRLSTWATDTGTISGVITDGASSFGITKTGTGTLTMTQANTYDGTTVIGSGRINIRNAASLGTGAVTIGNSESGADAISLYLDTNRINFVRAITVTNNSTGTVTLGSMNTVGSSGDNNQFTNIALQRDVIFDSNAADRTDYENISGVGNITFTGTGRSILITTNSFIGNITLSQGIGGNLQIGTATAGNLNYIPDTASLTVNDTLSNTVAEFRISVGGETIAGLNGNGTIDTNSINATLTVGFGDVGGSFSGVIQNGGSNTVGLTKIGTGTQVLSGANTTTGIFSANGGLLRLDSANAISGGLAATGGTAHLSLNGGVVGLGNGDLLRALGTGATQVQIAGGASGFSAHTADRTVNFGGAGAAITWGAGNFLPSTLVLSHSTATHNLTLVNAIDLGTTARSVQVDNGSATVDGTLSGALSGSGALTKSGLGTLALSGSNTWTSNINHNAGTLRLDYSTNNNSKLGDAAVVTLGAGATTWELNGGSHTEVIGSTTLSANAMATINRLSGTSVLQLGTITRNANATLALGASGIASTNNTNTDGILGTWATVGNDWAVNSTNAANGLINALTTYSDVSRLSSGAKSIANDVTANVRIIEGTGTSANITLAAATTHINTLNMTATGGTSTLAIGTGNTLRFGTAGGLLAGSGVSRFDITGGTLSAGGNVANTAGVLTVTGNTGNAVSVSSVLANNGTGAVSLVKNGSGTLILNANNTFSGGTTINQGTVAISAMGTATTAGGNVNGFGTGAVTVNADGRAWIHGSTSSFGTVANAFNLAGGRLYIHDGATTFSGAIAVSAASIIEEFWGDAITFSGVISGAGSLTFQRAASGSENPAFILNGNNTFTGAVTAAANITVRAGTATALGTTAAGTTVLSGGVLDLNGQTIGAETVTLNGAGIGSGGALINSSTGTAASLSGAVAMASSSSIGGAGNLTLSGIISGTNTALTKVGAGTVTLSGNNTFTGNSTVSGGRLNISGTNTASFTVNSGATLGGTGSTNRNLTFSAGSTIALNGTAPTSGLTASGIVSFTGATSLIFDAVPTGIGTISHRIVSYGTLATGIGSITGPSGYRSVVVNDAVNSRVLLNVTTATRTWNRTSAGTWSLLSGTNFAEGDQQFAVGDSVVFDDTATDGDVTLSGNLLVGLVNVNNSVTNYTFSGSGSIAGNNGVSKSGTGTFTINNANTYTGLTSITGGTLMMGNAAALGSTAGGTTVSNGGALGIQGGVNSAEALTIAGTGVSSGGAIRNISGTNTLSGGISLTAAATVTSVAGGLTLSGAVTSASGTQTLTIGGGNVTMSGANNTVDIVINGGTLFARGGNWSTTFAGGRTITVNTGGTLDTITHSLNGLGGGSRPANIVINEDAIWKLNGEQQLPSSTLTLNAGIVNGPGDIRGGGTIASIAHATKSSTINAPLSTGNGAITFNVADGAVGIDLSVTGNIIGGNAINKNTGTGLLEFSGTNSHTGATNINAGTLRITTSSGLGTTAAGTSVASGATLELTNNIAVGAEALNVSGNGVGSNGALRSASGTNSYAGAITLAAASRIQTDAGTLSIGGNISNGTNLLTIGGEGNTTISGAIDGSSGGLTKDGGGTLTLSGTSTYSGATSVSAGTLLVTGALGSTNVNVAANAAFGGTGSIGGNLNLDAASIFTVADLNDSLSVSGVITFGSGFGIANLFGIDWDALDLDTSYTIISTSQTFSSSDIANFGLANATAVGTGRMAYFQNGSLQVVVIPETSTALLGALGALVLLRRRR